MSRVLLSCGAVSSSPLRLSRRNSLAFIMQHEALCAHTENALIDMPWCFAHPAACKHFAPTPRTTPRTTPHT